MNRTLLAMRAMMAIAAMPMMAQGVNIMVDDGRSPPPLPDVPTKRQKPPKPQVVRLPDERHTPAAKSSSLKRMLAQKGRK